MAFLSGIFTTKRGNDFLFVIMDRLTKRVILVAANKRLTGQGAARIFMEKVFSQHGMQRAIISDRDPRFTGSF